MSGASNEIVTQEVWRTADGPVLLTNQLVVASTGSLTIEPGVEIRAGAEGNILVHGVLEARGTPTQPITFTRAQQEGAWGGIAIIGERVFNDLTATGMLEYCEFAFGAHEYVSPLDAPAMLYAHQAVLSISDCRFGDLPGAAVRARDCDVGVSGSRFVRCGEAINVIRCSGRVSGNYISFVGNGADAIDVDLEWIGLGWKPMVVEGNVISHISGDGIDLGSSAARVRRNLIRNCADKGISVGEGSNARIENNVILRCRLGIAVKDSSTPVMANNTIVGCDIGVSCYEKELGMGGARGHLLNTIVWNCGRSIELDELSLLDVRHCLLQGPIVWPGTGCLTNDPQFVDTAADDVRLAPASPVHGAGIPTRAPTNDFHGVTRSAAPTLGALETSIAETDSDGDGVTDDADGFVFHPGWSGDTDGDGLPDLWELQYFGSLTRGPDEDPDGDGLLVLEEFQRGASPIHGDHLVIINEIMYHPDSDDPAHEYIELFNRGSMPLDLTGWQLIDEVCYDFPAGTLLPADGLLVVAGDPDAVEALYGLAGAHGPWSGELGDVLASVRLVNAQQADIDTVEYRSYDAWPVEPDGAGPSLELMQPSADNNVGSNWAPSALDGGTPGGRNSRAEGDVVINEFLASSAGGVTDWIELYNRGSVTQDISGWFLSDRLDDPRKWAIPAGTRLAPGGMAHFTRNSFGFGLSGDGEKILLTRADGATIESYVSYEEQFADVAQGRWANGYPAWHLYPGGGSPQQANPAPPAAAVVINEIMYHPTDDESGEEYIELYNAGAADVQLTGWAFTDGIQYDFPPGTVHTAGTYLVIGHQPLRVEFKYRIQGVLGPFTSGRLSNRGERLELRDAYGNVVDSVHYQDRGRWPRTADGDGPSLELRHHQLDNMLPEAWLAHAGMEGTPGATNAAASGAAAAITAVGHFPVTPTSLEEVTVRARVFSGTHPVRLRWKRDQDELFHEIVMADDGSGDHLHAAVIPAQPHQTLIEYYIAVASQAEAPLTWPPGAPLFHLEEGGRDMPLSGRYLVDEDPQPTAVPIYRILMPDETIAELLGRPVSSDELLPVTLLYGDAVFPFARLRYRGTVLGKRGWPVKSYRIDLRYDHPHAGEDRLNFNGKRPGPEWLATAYFSQGGYATPELQNIRLYINDQDQGPYLFAERIGSEYMERNYPGQNDREWFEAWGEVGAGDNTVYPPVISNRLSAVFATNRNDYVKHVSQAIDTANWLGWLVTTSILGDHETLLNTFSGNHATTVHPATGHLELEPLDLDATWNPDEAGMLIHIDDSTSVLGWSYALEALETFMRAPYFQRRYYEQIAEELDSGFTAERLSDPIDAYFSVVGSGLESSADDVRDYLLARPAVLENQLQQQIRETEGFVPAVSQLEEGALYWLPYADGWIAGTVVPGSARVLVNGSSAGVVLDSQRGMWQYAAWLPPGDTPLTLASVPLVNRAYETASRTVTVRYDPMDDDEDTLPNSWENAYGLDPLDDGSIDPANGADGDPDGDGLSNSVEYQLRTSPVDPGDEPPIDILSCEWSRERIILVFTAVPGWIYRLQSADELTDSAWQDADTGVTAKTTTATFETSPMAGIGRFYRVYLEPAQE